MATTRPLTDDQSFWVTTFFGGEERGRCFMFTANKDGMRIQKTFSEEELLTVLCEDGLATEDDGIRPEFDI